MLISFFLKFPDSKKKQNATESSKLIGMPALSSQASNQ